MTNLLLQAPPEPDGALGLVLLLLGLWGFYQLTRLWEGFGSPPDDKEKD